MMKSLKLLDVFLISLTAPKRESYDGGGTVIEELKAM